MRSVQDAVAALLEDQATLGLEGLPQAALVPVRVAGRVASAPVAATKPMVKPTPASATRPAQPPASLATPVPADKDASACATALAAIRTDLGDCTRCKLHKGRKHIVFGVGNPAARLVFVGEGPGADEDAQGEPFVGKAGQLLTKMIEAMGFARSDVYICNVVKCRPPNNRDPEPDEVAACEPFLIQQLGAVRPEVVVALGKHAAHTLLRETTPITRMRGKWREYHGVKLMPTYHPAYLLRNPAEKRAVWADLQEVLRALNLPVPGRAQ